MLNQQPSLCSCCANLGETCCQGREIYITPGDQRRISTVAQSLPFVVWRRPTDPIYLGQSNDPLWQRHVFCKDGSRRTLKTKPNGDCIFLSTRGCRLPVEIRPLLCRLHPFTYTANGIDREPDLGCPRHLLADGESVFDATGTPWSLALTWHHQLYEEILTDLHDDRTD